MCVGWKRSEIAREEGEGVKRLKETNGLAHVVVPADSRTAPAGAQAHVPTAQCDVARGAEMRAWQN